MRRISLALRRGDIVTNEVLPSSISVIGKSGYRIFSLPTVDKLDEIYAKDNEDTKIVERLFGSSLVVVVAAAKPNSLKMLHFKKKIEICHCVYPSDILSIRMNRQRLVVCLADSLHIHDIRDMKILHSIENVCPNELGTFALSLNSHLAYPISTTTGELKIFNANKLKPGLVIKAHETQLSALKFSPTGNLLATASERGTVIRLFCTKNGHKVHEFRRGVKRCVRIASLIFSGCGDYLCASSNTETVHIFKINQKAVDAIERRSIVNNSNNDNNNCDNTNSTNINNTNAISNTTTTATSTDNTKNKNLESSNDDVKNCDYDDYESSWSGYLTKAITSYLPNPMYDVFNQDRAYATAQLPQPNLRHVCGLTKIEKQLKLLVACEDGFLYIYDFCDSQGGNCKMIRVHDLRCPLEDVIELSLTDGSPVRIRNASPIKQITYANILRGTTDRTMTDSDKYRNLCDAIDTPAKIFDEIQFPPVAAACE